MKRCMNCGVYQINILLINLIPYNLFQIIFILNDIFAGIQCHNAICDKSILVPLHQFVLLQKHIKQIHFPFQLFHSLHYQLKVHWIHNHFLMTSLQVSNVTIRF
eukprot:541288_1